MRIAMRLGEAWLQLQEALPRGARVTSGASTRKPFAFLVMQGEACLAAADGDDPVEVWRALSAALSAQAADGLAPAPEPVS